MVWLRNPLHELRVAYGAQLEHGALDVLIQSDHDESNEIPSRSQHEECARSAWCERRACEAEVCGGFYYLRASAPAIAMLEAFFERMAWQRQHVDPRIGEQPALNYVLRRSSPPARYLVLPRELYPNGNAYFARRIWPRSSRALPIIIHNNWLAGAEAKRQRFIDHGLWFVKETKERSLDHAGHMSRHREAPAVNRGRVACTKPRPHEVACSCMDRERSTQHVRCLASRHAVYGRGRARGARGFERTRTTSSLYFPTSDGAPASL